MAKQPYRPRVSLPEGLEHKRADYQAKADAKMAAHELFFEVVNSVLPSGGRGFKTQYYWRDTPIPCGPQSTHQEMVAAGRLLGHH